MDAVELERRPAHPLEPGGREVVGALQRPLGEQIEGARQHRGAQHIGRCHKAGHQQPRELIAVGRRRPGEAGGVEQADRAVLEDHADVRRLQVERLAGGAPLRLAVVRVLQGLGVVHHELCCAIGHVEVGGDPHDPVAVTELPHRPLVHAGEVPVGKGRRRVGVGVRLNRLARVAHAGGPRDRPRVCAVGALRGEFRLLGPGDAGDAPRRHEAQPQRTHRAPLGWATHAQASDTDIHCDRSSP